LAVFVAVFTPITCLAVLTHAVRTAQLDAVIAIQARIADIAPTLARETLGCEGTALGVVSASSTRSRCLAYAISATRQWRTALGQTAAIDSGICVVACTVLAKRCILRAVLSVGARISFEPVLATMRRPTSQVWPTLRVRVANHPSRIGGATAVRTAVQGRRYAVIGMSAFDTFGPIGTVASSVAEGSRTTFSRVETTLTCPSRLPR